MLSKQEKQLNQVDTIVGSGTTLNGDVESEASIRIDGTVTGSVICSGDVVIGSEGKVEAEVKGRNVTVAGMVKGNITSKHTLKIEATGKLMGDAKMAVFVIDEGGKFDGKSQMESTSESGSNHDKNNKNDKNEHNQEQQSKKQKNKKKNKAS
ncbi:bactofilin family protein [Tenuibacillus multivorans]|uniref:Polymer-forming protein n=1 Tax=Tenuibacillus multivorans TaxID=237069 RepID=A0A1G9W4F5_9BACI|nr:polymer-forming cytoskeletal protein [Tenuibacillus multivorans]GEL78762.1 hypothetical protein TMU01_29970 [Tenuibacillus multivorans]SDM79418.1 Polymer-forming protein [Tenuibacillus multivorans]